MLVRFIQRKKEAGFRTVAWVSQDAFRTTRRHILLKHEARDVVHRGLHMNPPTTSDVCHDCHAANDLNATTAR
jgi:hypothetical protein